MFTHYLIPPRSLFSTMLDKRVVMSVHSKKKCPLTFLSLASFSLSHFKQHQRLLMILKKCSHQTIYLNENFYHEGLMRKRGMDCEILFSFVWKWSSSMIQFSEISCVSQSEQMDPLNPICTQRHFLLHSEPVGLSSLNFRWVLATFKKNFPPNPNINIHPQNLLLLPICELFADKF
jgi:hypothetical protein